MFINKKDMQIPSFNIQYNATIQPAKARLTNLCSPAELSLGMKDICIYLRNGLPADSDIAETIPQLYIAWEKNPDDILSDEKLVISQLEQIGMKLKDSQSIDRRMQTSNFLFNDLIDECNQLILNIQAQGLDVVRSRSKKRLNYLLDEIGERIIVRNKLIVHSTLSESIRIPHILQEIYNEIPQKVRKHFDYVIDFESLSFEKQ